MSYDPKVVTAISDAIDERKAAVSKDKAFVSFIIDFEDKTVDWDSDGIIFTVRVSELLKLVAPERCDFTNAFCCLHNPHRSDAVIEAQIAKDWGLDRKGHKSDTQVVIPLFAGCDEDYGSGD